MLLHLSTITHAVASAQKGSDLPRRGGLNADGHFICNNLILITKWLLFPIIEINTHLLALSRQEKRARNSAAKRILAVKGFRSIRTWWGATGHLSEYTRPKSQTWSACRPERKAFENTEGQRHDILFVALERTQNSEVTVVPSSSACFESDQIHKRRWNRETLSDKNKTRRRDAEKAMRYPHRRLPGELFQIFGELGRSDEQTAAEIREILQKKRGEFLEEKSAGG